MQLGLLINAAEQNWREVEPAIFGTLLERALNKRERHKLGAHYTPRAYVERLEIPTVIDPLRADCRVAQVCAIPQSSSSSRSTADSGAGKDTPSGSKFLDFAPLQGAHEYKKLS